MKAQIHGIVVELKDASELPAKAAEVIKQVEATYFEKFGLRALAQNVKAAVGKAEDEVEKILGLNKTEDTPVTSTDTSEAVAVVDTVVPTETEVVAEAPAQETATETSVVATEPVVAEIAAVKPAAKKVK